MQSCFGLMETQSLENGRGTAQYPDRYRAALHAFCRIARDCGYSIEPFSNGQESRFLSYPAEQQATLVHRLESQLKIYRSCLERGLNLGKGGSKLAWWAIRDLKFRPLSDVFSLITDEDVIEIYDLNHVQVFRSFNFLGAVSYSLDEILTHEWRELYIRDENVTQYMVSTLESVLRSDEPKTVSRLFPRHSLSERFSLRKINAELESKVLSPLFDDYGRVAGYIHTFHLFSMVNH